MTGDIISVEDVVKRHGAVEALRGVSFAVSGPQVIGVLGPNGAGKTTLLEILEGLTTPDSGRVRLFGEPLGAAPYPRRRVGVVLQKEPAFDGMSVGDHAELFGALYGVAPARILEDAELAGRARTPVDRLSGGEAQRLAIAAVSAHGPDLLLLDEPTAHLDPGNRRRIGERIRALGARCTVVLTTHDLREAEAVCDRVLFLHGGEVKAHGTVLELAAGLGLEDAFFRLCNSRIAPGGEAL